MPVKIVIRPLRTGDAEDSNYWPDGDTLELINQAGKEYNFKSKTNIMINSTRIYSSDIASLPATTEKIQRIILDDKQASEGHLIPSVLEQIERRLTNDELIKIIEDYGIDDKWSSLVERIRGVTNDWVRIKHDDIADWRR